MRCDDPANIEATLKVAKLLRELSKVTFATRAENSYIQN